MGTKAKINKVKYYMHTMDGRPAVFDGDQISFAGKTLDIDELAETLDQVKEQRKMSKQWREKRGWTEDYRMDYIIVYV